MEPTTEQVIDWVRKQKRRRKFCPRCLFAPYHGASIKCLRCGLDFVEATYNIGYYLDNSKLKHLGLTYAQDALGFWRVTHARPQMQCSETAWEVYMTMRDLMGDSRRDNPIYSSNHTRHPDRECILWQQTLAKVKESLWHLNSSTLPQNN